MTRYSPKAVRVQYYDWDLIVPAKSCVKCGEHYWVAYWAIKSAKEREVVPGAFHVRP